jgi:hypothetical protein
MHQAHRLALKWARAVHVYLTMFGFALLLFFAVSGFMLNHEDWFLAPETTAGTIPADLLSASDNQSGIEGKLRDDFSVVGELETFETTDAAYRAVFKADDALTVAVIRRDTGAVEISSTLPRSRERITIVEGKMPVELLVPDDPSKELPIVERLRKDFGVHGEVITAPKYEKESEMFRVVFKSPGYLATATIKADGQTKVTHQSRGVAGIVLDLHRGKDTGWLWSLIIDAVAIVFVIVGITGLVLWSSLKSRAQSAGRWLLVGTVIGFAVYWFSVPR